MVGLSLLYPVLSVLNDSNIEGVFNLGVIFKYLPQNINQGLNISNLLSLLLSVYVFKTIITLLSSWFETKLLANLHRDISNKLFSKLSSIKPSGFPITLGRSLIVASKTI